MVSLSRLLRKSTSGSWQTTYQHSGPSSAAEESPIQRQNSSRFMGTYKQDAATPHCYQSHHQMICVYKVSLIYLYTLIPITIVRILYTSGTILPPLLLLLLLLTTTSTSTATTTTTTTTVAVVVLVVVEVIVVNGHLHSACPTGDEELKERVVIPERRTNLCETEFQQLRCEK